MEKWWKIQVIRKITAVDKIWKTRLQSRLNRLEKFGEGICGKVKIDSFFIWFFRVFHPKKFQQLRCFPRRKVRVFRKRQNRAKTGKSFPHLSTGFPPVFPAVFKFEKAAKSLFISRFSGLVHSFRRNWRFCFCKNNLFFYSFLRKSAFWSRKARRKGRGALLHTSPAFWKKLGKNFNYF